MIRSIAREAGFRFLARHKAAFGIAVLTMAVALGANTLVFSALKTFVFSTMAVAEPDRLFILAPVRNLAGRGTVVFSEAYPNYELIHRTQKAFAHVALSMPGVSTWEERGESRALQTARVTSSFFATMGVVPAPGRAFTHSDEEGAHPARDVVISSALWKGAMAGESSVLGKTMLLDGQPFTVVGVMPEGFAQPVGTDIWVPLDVPPGDRVAITGARHYSIYARLGADRPLRDADIEAADLTARTVAANADNKGFRYEARPLRRQLLDGADATLFLVQEGAVALLLLAVINLASLLLAWGFERQAELAVRRALGASSWQTIRILLLQSLVVVGFGALIAIGLTRLALPWLRALPLGQSLTSFTSHIVLDTGVLIASAAAAGVAGLIAGILPALLAHRSDAVQSIRTGMRSATLSPAALRWQKGMVVGQAALSVVILGAATLVGLSFRNLQHVPSGFAAEGAIVARVQLDGAKYADSVARSNLGRALIDNLEHEPAIAAAGFSSTLPVSDPGWVTFFHIAMPDGSLSKDQVLFNIRRVSPGYLKTLGIPLLTGRQFDAHDDERSPNVAIVSRALAERAWPGESAIGKRIYRVVPGSTQPSALTVVGVVGSVTDAGATAPPGETVYIPWSQLSVTRLSIVVRARGSDEAAVSAIRHSLRAVDPLLAAHHVAKLDTLLDDAHALQRLQSVLLLTFAVGAMLMAMLGCYGVMTQLVTTREREYALRLVFGASAAELGRSVIHQVAWLTVPGVLVGSLGMIPLAGVIKRFVFGIDPKSPALLAAVAASVLGIALVAALPSVIRAMRTDVRRAMTS